MGSGVIQGTEIGWSRKAPHRGWHKEPISDEAIRDPSYDSLYQRFNPTLFNAKEWVQIAQDTGMRYLVFTTRHHDGFSMFDTAVSEHRITAKDCPFGRDVVKELADACHANGMRFGEYYSQPDWHHPDAFHADPARHQRYVDYLRTQIRELMTKYGQVDLVWFDGLGKGKVENDYGSLAMNRLIRSLQPNIIINNRNGIREDFDTPEQRVGVMQIDRPWESCITICHQWSWKPDDKLKSLDECIRYLVATITGDGNLLLNVGPMPDGRIEPRQVDRLKEIGTWVKANSEAIYGTRGGPWRNGGWGGSTYRDKTIYVHLVQAPPAGRLRLGALPHHITGAKVLTTGAPVTVVQDEQAVTLTLNADQFQAPGTVIAVTVDEPVRPGQVIGVTGGVFSDALVFGKPLTGITASATATGGTATVTVEPDGIIAKSTGANGAALTIDLGASHVVTGVAATSADAGYFGASSTLRAEISADGTTWVEVWKGAMGQPAYDIPVTVFTAGIDQPGREARFVRLKQDKGNLAFKQVRVYAK